MTPTRLSGPGLAIALSDADGNPVQEARVLCAPANAGTGSWSIARAGISNQGGMALLVPIAAGLSNIAIVAPGRAAQVGVLESAGKEPVALFGRPTRRGSDRWNYFAVTTSYTPQKLPVLVRGVDAARLAGCAELSDGESVDVRGYGAAKVALYTRDDAEHRFALRAD